MGMNSYLQVCRDDAYTFHDRLTSLIDRIESGGDVEEFRDYFNQDIFKGSLNTTGEEQFDSIFDFILSLDEDDYYEAWDINCVGSPFNGVEQKSWRDENGEYVSLNIDEFKEKFPDASFIMFRYNYDN